MKEVQIIRPTIVKDADKILKVAAYCRVSTASDDQMFLLSDISSATKNMSVIF